MFSESVDNLMLRASRTDAASRANIVSYLNASLREMQQTGHYYRDRVEFQIDLAGETGDVFVWNRPRNFRTLAAVEYMPGRCVAKLKPPGPSQHGQLNYYYGGPNYFTFVGVKGKTFINLAYYSWAFRMNYYEENKRPAKYNRITGTWEYLNAAGHYVSFLDDPIVQETAQILVGHWVLEDYKETVEEGALAKFFKTYDDQKASGSFAVYSTLKRKFETDEVDESTIGRTN